MRFLETWVETPLAQAVGWTLVHSLWEGAIILAVLLAALLTIQSARVRYAAACVAMLVMLGGFGLTLVRVMPESGHGLRTATAPAITARDVRADANAPGAANPGLSAVVPWLSPLWLAGVWILALGHVSGWVHACRLRRRGVCCAAERWQKDLARLCARMRLSRPVLLLESCLADVPMVIGHLRPVILLPIGLLTGLPARQIEAILLHELAHIRRCDYLVNLLQRSLECLFFYHPAVWWISRLVRAERENCCDDAVVEMTGNVQEYAAALTALEQSRWHGREVAVASTGGNLVKRVRRLLYPQVTNGVWTSFVAASIFITTAAVALTAWPSKPLSQSTAVAPQAMRGTETSPYDRWLNQEVVYIIGDEERAAFQKLTTDEERNKFIQQFWERRNPNPGSPKNRFKEEHYRRIAYVNERFASSRPGWQTDRGHMYIVYGPPDEIDSYAKGELSAYAIQAWTYRHIEGIGDNVSLTFIDRMGTGDFRLAPGNPR